MTELAWEKSKIIADSTERIDGGLVLSGALVTVELSAAPGLFYRHGWQSWSLATWIDPSTPPVTISAPELSAKDEDPMYACSSRHISAWVGAAESKDGSIILLGALDLGGRVELKNATLHGFYETGSGEWILIRGTEEQVFSAYTDILVKRFCKVPASSENIPKIPKSTWESRHARVPRIWCSWYSLYGWVKEYTFLKALEGLGDLTFDVVQLDDGWECACGDWEANKKFPSGMTSLAEKIRQTGRMAGLWLAPFMVTLKSKLARQHPDWLLRDERGQLVRAGLSWNGTTYALDTGHPEVLDWVEALIHKVRGWGFEYLKLDFLYAGALPGNRRNGLAREPAYRQAMQRIRSVAGGAYILGCGAPIIPSLGVCDGIRIGPDVTPYWINTPMSLWLNNPAHPSAKNALRTCLHRLWLQPVIHTDPDVIYFRSIHNALTLKQKGLLRDLGFLSHFKSTSDIPAWLTPAERRELGVFLATDPQIQRLTRDSFRINDRMVDFSSFIPIPPSQKFPARLALVLGLYDMVVHEAAPAILESFKKHS